jgi:acetyl esterase/lipase
VGSKEILLDDAKRFREKFINKLSFIEFVGKFSNICQCLFSFIKPCIKHLEVMPHLHGLPPTLVQVGSKEILLDDAKRFREKAEDAGVKAYSHHL